MATLSTFFDMVYVYATESSGHGPFTLGAAVTGFQTAASAGITNGTPVSYRATDGTNWETAHGIVDVSGSTYTLTRGIDTIKSSNSNSLVSFSSGVTVAITELSQDLNGLVSAAAAQSFSSSQQAQAQSNINAEPKISAAQQYSAAGNVNTSSGNPGVMTGSGYTFTPSTTGRLLIIFNFSADNNTAGAYAVFIAHYGTGTAPSAGAAVSGTVMGGTYAVGLTANTTFQVCVPILVSGLTIGTTYWFDMAFYSQAAGISYYLNATATIIEL